MTIKELSKYYNTKQEIIQIQESITEIESTIISSSKMTGMPISKNGNSNITERIGIKLINLKQSLSSKCEKLIDEYQKIEDYTDTVLDSEVRVIIRKRFLDGKTWNVIGDELSMDRSTPYYKLTKYLERENKNEVQETKFVR